MRESRTPPEPTAAKEARSGPCKTRRRFILHASAERERSIKRMAAQSKQLAGLLQAHWDLQEEYGVELLVIALSLDVQVSAQEWKKYGVDDDPGMEDSLALLGDLSTSARASGARAWDASSALRARDSGVCTPYHGGGICV